MIKGRSYGLDRPSRVVRVSPVAASRQMAKMHAPATTQTMPAMTVMIKASPLWMRPLSVSDTSPTTSKVKRWCQLFQARLKAATSRSPQIPGVESYLLIL